MTKINLKEILQKEGYNPPPDEYRGKVETWKQWYSGYTSDFHDWRYYNGEAWVQCRRATLRMAKTACERWANLLWNRECFIAVDDDAPQEALEEALQDNNFTWALNQAIDRAFGVGTNAVIVYEEAGEPRIEFVDVDYIYPLVWRNGVIESCAFAGVDNNAGQYDTPAPKVVYIMIHIKNADGTYTVRNLFFAADENENVQGRISTPTGIKEKETVKTCRFGIIKPNLINNEELKSPFGISVYANAIDVLKAIDLAYDGIIESMKQGRPRMAVAGEALKPGPDGLKMVFDPQDTFFYQMGQNASGEEGKLIVDLTTEWRGDKFLDGFEGQLKFFGKQTGLGETAFEFTPAKMETAAEVHSVSSETARTNRKHQDGILIPVKNVCRACLDIKGYDPNQDVGVTFDDSVVVNTEQEKQRWLSMAMAGKIPLWYYLVEFEGLSEADAKAIDLDSLGLNEDEDEGEE